MRWTEAKIARLSKPGLYNLAGGLGLYVSVTGAGGRSYIARYRRDGKRREMGLGSTRFISLDQAMEAALEIRRLLAKGGDPLPMRRQSQAEARVAELQLVPWKECVDKYVESKSKGWTAGFTRRWEKRMEHYAEPILGKLPVGAVDDQLVLRVLDPIWNNQPATANMLRMAIEAVIDYAVSSGRRPAALNPARWKGHLENIFAAPQAIKPVKHHEALPYAEAPAFFAILRGDPSEVAYALRMIVLNGGRKMEVCKATWGEFDLVRNMWNVPTHHLKQRKNMNLQRRGHDVPLSSGMLEVLAEMRQRCGGHPRPTNLVFASSRPAGALQKPLGEVATQQLIRRLGFVDRCTVHGFVLHCRIFLPNARPSAVRLAS
jgi:integrase